MRTHNTRSGKPARIRRRCLKVVSQNLLGIKPTSSNDRLEELLVNLQKRNDYAFLVQETWRAGSKVLHHKTGMVIVAEGPQTQTGRGSKGVAIVLSAQAVLGWEKAGKAVYGGYGGRVLGLRTVVVDKKKKEREEFS